MMKRNSCIYLIILVGFIFLLHMVVPHHHHGDEISFEQHLLEHHHHPHQEQVIDEAMLFSALTQHHYDLQNVLVQPLLSGKTIELPIPQIIQLFEESNSEKENSYSSIVNHFRGLRAPPIG